MEELGLVTYCGLYCGLCAQRGRIPAQAQALKHTMTAEGYEFFGDSLPGFRSFWEFLSELCNVDKACPGCRAGGGYPACEIRTCARERQVDACPFCADYPCEKIKRFERTYPTLVTDGLRLKQIGVEAWVEEQKQRAATGFVYADIRHPRTD